jgi:hypothetical protein
MASYEQPLVAASSLSDASVGVGSARAARSGVAAVLSRVAGGLWRDAAAPTRLACLVIALFGVLDLVLVPVQGFTVAGAATLLSVVAPLPLAAIAAFYTSVRPDQRLSTIAWAFTMLLACMVVVGPFSYLGASWGLPTVDAVLAHVDSMLGFDWVAYNDLATRSRPVQIAMGWLYASSVPQVFVLVIVLASLKRVDRVREMVFLLVIGGFITASLASLFPALGAHTFHGVPDHGKALYLGDLLGLRSGALRHLDPPSMVGLCTWPSFHTIISLTLIRVTRRVPVVGLLTLVWNGALLSAVPVWGSHFLADMIGGAVVVIGLVAALLRLERPVGRAGAPPRR